MTCPFCCEYHETFDHIFSCGPGVRVPQSVKESNITFIVRWHNIATTEKFWPVSQTVHKILWTDSVTWEGYVVAWDCCF